jgi:hypothetical protein
MGELLITTDNGNISIDIYLGHRSRGDHGQTTEVVFSPPASLLHSILCG